ncbi:MAG: hypothetical protein MUO51_17455, partial [Woeseiaceae bacterium]|nr:hypothetical protein [Woeseiaceae bacterium]
IVLTPIVVTITAMAHTVATAIGATIIASSTDGPRECPGGWNTTGRFATGSSTLVCEKTVTCHGMSCSIFMFGSIPAITIVDRR